MRRRPKPRTRPLTEQEAGILTYVAGEIRKLPPLGPNDYIIRADPESYATIMVRRRSATAKDKE